MDPEEELQATTKWTRLVVRVLCALCLGLGGVYGFKSVAPDWTGVITGLLIILTFLVPGALCAFVIGAILERLIVVKILRRPHR